MMANSKSFIFIAHCNLAYIEYAGFQKKHIPPVSTHDIKGIYRRRSYYTRKCQLLDEESTGEMVNPPMNYLLLDEESTRGMEFHWELPALV
jgi:hypothetical protein